ncbi:integrating conjugative element protein [Alloalcanivorax xenomutans]|uniref:Integrating conjugative element protein n=2 Tax=Alloalcanivorax xenomutans TaxID=1094342 RepID=A0A9Q3W6A1_9GAMM|nr:integrating conjugative element protein [Alloalcanivorax xenomutans]MAO61074.1 integrating conjugative element protein [Alcanivorax sp.]MAY11563.1 integrating conjugative element protein [Alcanivorax sp.]MBI54040.1 integrating conjugative element protein [Alcanivorax sp.]MCE7511295.1 integrating conjugative element protein [Alloalcanivorax xenomutans]MCE7525126.1 integrating conjugative element protein [Alloalcanivorax xenomutans]|tara:strand:- start:41157 stop:41696 length:540 start_codon:yes stop_codon:yes gene_type:complete
MLIRPLITLFTLIMTATAVHAQVKSPLTVVADDGGQPARPYYVAIGAAQVDEEDGFVVATPDTVLDRPATEADMLPVVSERLSIGPVVPRALDLPPGTTPFFLIGTDPDSVRWLKQRRERLVELRAVGMVVNVATAEDLAALRERAPGLELRPIPGDDLAERLSLTHYPVLITPTRLEQ